MCETRPRLIAYGVALLATAVSLLIRWPLWPVLEDHAALLTFIPAVVFSAYQGGFRPGLLATLLGALAAHYFLTEPYWAFKVPQLYQTVCMTLFVTAGAIISGLSESLHRAQLQICASERQRTEEARRQTEKRFQQLAENIHEIFWLMDPRGQRMIYISPGYEEVSGRTRQSLYEQPRSWVENIHPDDRDKMSETVEQYARGVFPEAEFRLVRPNGSVRWMRSRAFPLNEPGEPGTPRVVRVAGLAEDITERKQTEEALAQERYLLHTLMENAPDNIFFKDEAGRFLRINKALTTYFGLSDPSQAIGKTDFDFFTEEHARAASEDEQEIIRTGLPLVAKEEKETWLDGRVRWVSTTKMPFRDKDGKIVGTFGLARDITKVKLAKEALRQSEHRWRNLTEALPQLVWSAAPDGTCTWFSPQWTHYTGVQESNLLGWRWLEVLHPEDRQRTREFWTASIEGRGPYDVEYRIRHCDGQYRWFKTRGTPIRDEAGRILDWFGTCTDIDDQKGLEEEARESRERLRAALSASGTGTFRWDICTGTMAWDESLSRLFGLASRQTVKQLEEFLCLVHPDDRAAVVDRCFSCERRGEDFELDFRVVWPDGSIHWLADRGKTWKDVDGRPIYMTGACVDITERKRAEEELRQAKELAESANRAKDEFLANVSHEIRTPMNAILGMTDLVLTTGLTEDQRQCLKTVKSAADNLLRIINDLLDFARIEAGKLELDSVDFSLRTAVADTLRALAVRAHRKGLELISHVQADVPDALFGDAGRLRQVLLNLVGNAIKFTEKGEVVVRVEEASGDQGVPPSPRSPEVRLRFSVRDTGIGIPPEKQERIFRAFEQEDTSTTRKYGGTGLGLTIASRLIALMGGKISVDSELRQGSTFTFTARFGHQPQREPVAPPSPALLHDQRVLIVDDNRTNRHILKEWLRSWQMEPRAVGDGPAALDALWHGVRLGQPISLVLLDARMPDMDGPALAARIRSFPELAATRIILLTSGDRPSDRVRIHEVRIDAHLPKPLQKEELLETICKVLRPPEGDKVTEDRLASPVLLSSPRSLSILVAEDNELNVQLLELLLVRRGHRVRLAGNGKEALELAAEGGFDLLLLDIHMPELDGFGVVAAIRERERSTSGAATGLPSHLPIIALTARSREEDRQRCLAAGMDDFLVKPIHADDLWLAIDRVVRNRESEQAPDSDSSAAEGLLDPQVLLAACGGEDSILGTICRSFRARLPAALTAVQDALKDCHAPRLREAAHLVCGMVSAFSTVASRVASDIEDRAALGQLEESRPLVKRLSRLAGELVGQVDGLSVAVLQSQEGMAGSPTGQEL